MSQSLKSQIQEAMKDAMRAKEKERLAVVRLMLAAIKQIEVDERVELSDERVLAVLDKMIKQRRESIVQYQAASRSDLADAEAAEIKIIQIYLPTPLTESEIMTMIDEAVVQSSAKDVKDMGKVMGILKPRMQGKADMGEVGKLIKKRLS